VRAGLPLPAAAAACLLLIACANVAGLLLARGQRRLPEMAMRASLGASRGRLVRQSLTETGVLALPAAALGAGVALVLQEMLLHLLPVGALGVSEPLIDGSVLAFALAASLAAGLAAGLVPAIRGTAVSLSAHIGTGRQACEPAHGARLRGGLVIAQIAVSAALLVGAGLVARSLLRLSAVDVGFPADKILAARIEVPLSAYRDGAKRQAFFAAVLRDVEALPGVVAAGTATQAPLLDPRNIWATRPPGRVLSGSDLGELTRLRHVSPGYFGALNLPLLQGRGIPDSGPGAAEKVAVVSESLARRLYPGSDPVGRTVLLMDNLSSPPRELPYEIVGVAGDIRLSDPREAGSPTLYLPVSLANPNRLRLVVRAAGDPGGLAGPIRDIVRRLDRDALVTDVLTMDAAVEGASSSLRRVARYLGLFAGLSLLLAASGLYGALAYHVSRQEHEIGVRLAMGASRAGILRLVLRRGTALASAGLLLGLAAAWPGARLVESLLYETGTLDPVTYLGAVLLLGLAAASACFLPALRAARTDPALLLKSE
jgi:predicted permease